MAYVFPYVHFFSKSKLSPRPCSKAGSLGHRGRRKRLRGTNGGANGAGGANGRRGHVAGREAIASVGYWFGAKGDVEDVLANDVQLLDLVEEQ